MATIDALSKVAAGLTDPVVIAPPAPDPAGMFIAILAALAVACVIWCGSDSGAPFPQIMVPPPETPQPPVVTEVTPVPLDGAGVYFLGALVLLSIYQHGRQTK